MSNQLKILWVVNSMKALGGVEVMTIERLNGFRNLGYEVGLATYTPGELCNLLDKDIPVHHIANTGVDYPHIEDVVDAYGYNILHGHSCGGGADPTKVKVPGVVVGETIHSPCGGINPDADFEVVHTDLVHAMRPNSTLIYYGFNLDRLRPTMSKAEYRKKYNIPQETYVIGRCGRLDHSKDPMGFLEVLYRLPNVWGLMGGTGDAYQDLVDRANYLGISNRLVFTGLELNPGNLFQAIDCMVYPTADEAICASSIEAMFVKTPVVCYIRGGMSQHIIHERTALVGNSPVELSHYVTSIIENLHIGTKLSLNAYNRCDELGYWDFNKDLKLHLELYESCLRKKEYY